MIFHCPDQWLDSPGIDITLPQRASQTKISQFIFKISAITKQRDQHNCSLHAALGGHWLTPGDDYVVKLKLNIWRKYEFYNAIISFRGKWSMFFVVPSYSWSWSNVFKCFQIDRRRERDRHNQRDTVRMVFWYCNVIPSRTPICQHLDPIAA